ncbi:MAG: hypothetical protein RLZZ326_2429 [Planctomycetota bacterium]
MASEWMNTTIGDHVELLTGEAFKSSGFSDSGVRVARGDNVKEGEFEWGDKTRYWPTVSADLERYLLSDGDVLLGMDGSKVGKNWVQVRPKDLPCLLVQRVARLRGKETLDQGFLRFLIGNPAFRDYVHRVRTGTSIPHISGGQIKSYQIRLPPLSQQKRIAHILGTLDDKIDLNRRMNATLEAMSRAIFKSWFVDFDSVRSKAAGRQPEGMDAETAALFPDSFEESEIGEVPEGWGCVTLPDLVDINPPRLLRKGDDAAYLDMAGVPTQGHTPDELVVRPFGSGSRFQNGDTLLARITPCLENGKTAYVDFLNAGQVAWGSTEFIVLSPKPPLPSEYGYCLARDESFREFAIQSMTGSSGRQRVPVEALGHFRVASPPSEIALRFGRNVSPLFHHARLLADEIVTLATLRDTLLPKLLSGEVRVPEAEKAVEEAVG